MTDQLFTASMMNFSWLTQPDAWGALLTLTLLEIVLGIDNIIFISILVDRLAAHERKTGRFVGLALAMVARLVLLASITWIMSLKNDVFSIPVHPVLAGMLQDDSHCELNPTRKKSHYLSSVFIDLLLGNDRSLGILLQESISLVDEV